MKTAALACVLLLVCSCGGGSGGAAATLAGTADANLERTRAILETCTLDDLDRFLRVLDLISGAAEEGAEGPDLQISNINLLAAAVDWTLDVDRDLVVDMTGTIRFEDEAGNPTLPFDLVDLADGLGDIPSLLGAIRDGTTVIVSFTSAPDEAVSGNVAFTMVNGAPSTLSGQVTITSPDCVVRMDLEDAGGDLTGGAFPEATAHGTVTSTSGDVEGTISFDGTSSVALDMAIDGSAEVYAFVYDLETGELTEVD